MTQLARLQDGMRDGGSTLAELEQLPIPASGRAIYLNEGGRSGNFVFDDSDLSSEVSADTQQGIYIAPSSDATGASGAWVRQYDDTVNVKWFGAVGDGVTDDAAAIQAALNSTAQEVVFAPGVYSIGIGVSVPPFVTMRGSGWGDTQPTIKQGDGANITGALITNKGYTDSATVAGGPVTIRDLFINGNRDNNTGIADGILLMTYNSVIENVQVFNATGNGITFSDRNSAGGNITGTAVENKAINNRVTQCDGSGIFCTDNNTAITDCYIAGNTIGSCGGYGIIGRSGSRIINNHIYNVGFDGVAEQDGFNSKILGNKVEDWGQSGAIGTRHAFVVFNQFAGRPSQISGGNQAALINVVSGSTYYVFGATFASGVTTETGNVTIDGNSARLTGSENTLRATGSGSGTVTLTGNNIQGYTSTHLDNLGANAIIHYGNSFDKTFAALAGSGTPSVLQGCNFNTSANTIIYSNFTGGYEGQEILVYVANTGTTFDFSGGALLGNAGVDWTPSVGDFVRCTLRGAEWLCTITDTTA